MASQPENRFIASIHKLLPAGIHHEKMHNMYRGGTPDVYYSGHRADLWVEYKYLPKVPVRAGVDPTDGLLSTLQQQWLRGRHSEGRSVAVVVGCPSGGVIFSGLQWMYPLTAAAFVDILSTKKEIANWIAQHTLGETCAHSISTEVISADREIPTRIKPANDSHRPDEQGRSTTTGVPRSRRKRAG